MRILDQPDTVAEWIDQLDDSYASTDILGFGIHNNSGASESRQFSGNGIDAPIHAGSATADRCIRNEAKFEPADLKTHIEGFVEVRRGFKNDLIPDFGLGQVGRRINRRAQSLDHKVTHVPPTTAAVNAKMQPQNRERYILKPTLQALKECAGPMQRPNTQ